LPELFNKVLTKVAAFRTCEIHHARCVGNKTLFKHPIGLVLGLQDEVVLNEGVRKFAKLITDSRRVEVGTAGQLLIQKESDLVFCELDRVTNKHI